MLNNDDSLQLRNCIEHYDMNVRATSDNCVLIMKAARQIIMLTFKSPEVTICTTRVNIKNFHVLPTHCTYVFCMDLRTNSDYFPIQH